MQSLVRTGVGPAGCRSFRPQGGPGTRDGPAWFGLAAGAACRQVTRNATSRVPVIVFHQPDHGGLSPRGPLAGDGRAGPVLACQSPVTARAGAPRRLHPRWLRRSIPQVQTARSHRPRAVEHRDCPPCGGDMGSIAQGRGGGDGCFSIPQLAGVSGLISWRLGFLDSAGLATLSSSPERGRCSVR